MLDDLEMMERYPILQNFFKKVNFIKLGSFIQIYVVKMRLEMANLSKNILLVNESIFKKFLKKVIKSSTYECWDSTKNEK